MSDCQYAYCMYSRYPLSFSLCFCTSCASSRFLCSFFDILPTSFGVLSRAGPCTSQFNRLLFIESKSFCMLSSLLKKSSVTRTPLFVSVDVSASRIVRLGIVKDLRCF